MPETIYSYNITNDLPGGAVNTGSLHQAIEASSISTALKGITTNGGTYANSVITGGTMDIIFIDTLSAPDKTTLDGDTTGPAGGLLASTDNSEETKSTLLSSTGMITTTSKDFVLVPGMSATPSQGTYIVTFSGTMENDSKSKAVQVAIFADGTEVAHSKRKFQRGNVSQVAPFTCIAKITVNGSQAIEGRWKVDANSSGTITERSLLLTPE
jgi:hypothetical protein